jgi:hypothetical protein
MARIEWVQQRLENWARWHANTSSGGLGYATQAAFLAIAAGRDHANQARIPIDEIEASTTDEAVEALKLGYGHLHQTLRLFYLKGVGIKGTAQTMRRAESTIKAQLAQADALLAAWFTDRKRRKEAESAELRRKIEAARPAYTRQELPKPPAKPGRRKTLKLGSFSP